MKWSVKTIVIVLFTGLLFTCDDNPGINNYPSPARLPVYCRDTLFNKSFIEIKAMLDKQIPLNFKRAVFLSEYAYCGDEINYQNYTHEINLTVQQLQDFIKQRKIGQYKTAGNFAIFEYMTKPSQMNNNKAYIYDFNDFYGEKDWRSTFVTKLMRTKKGNCHSLPYYYKVLANEIGANAHLAFAPNHVYIKHKGEKGEWVNIELTNGSFSSDEWIIKSMGITPTAITNKIYMHAVSERQAIASCLFDLTLGYIVKYQEDEFALLCCNTILKYDSHNIQTLLLKNNILLTIGSQQKKIDKKNPSTKLKRNHEEYVKTRELINTLGYREMTMAEYDEWMRTVNEQRKLQNNENN